MTSAYKISKSSNMFMFYRQLVVESLNGLRFKITVTLKEK